MYGLFPLPAWNAQYPPLLLHMGSNHPWSVQSLACVHYCWCCTPYSVSLKVPVLIHRRHDRACGGDGDTEAVVVVVRACIHIFLVLPNMLPLCYATGFYPSPKVHTHTRPNLVIAEIQFFMGQERVCIFIDKSNAYTYAFNTYACALFWQKTHVYAKPKLATVERHFFWDKNSLHIYYLKQTHIHKCLTSMYTRYFV